MYLLSRWLLAVTVAAWACSGFMVLSMLEPLWSLGIVIALVALAMRSGIRRLTTLGSARWADEDDLGRMGMLHAESGLILGRMNARQSLVAAIRKLFSWRLSAMLACLGFWSNFRRGEQYVVRLPQAIHTAVFAPSGAGKGVSCVIPFLMTCEDSAVVVDFKGELALHTAEHRRRVFGHKIVLLDPFKVVTQSPDSFNPLDFIVKDSPVAIDECLDLANALVITTGEEREPHWNQSAEAWIAAFLSLVARYGGREDGTRSLQTVRQLLSDPQKLQVAVQAMCESNAWGGMLARMGGQLQQYVDKERSSTLTTVARHLRFLDTLAVAASTERSTFDPAELRKGKMTAYLILPPEHMRAKSALLRTWISALLRSVVREGLQERKKVQFVLDEAASLGRMDAIEDAVDKYRGFGVRCTFIYQSIGQLRKCFPEGQDVTLLSNVTQVFFGVNENSTAEYVSNRLGEETIIVDSGSRNSGSTQQWTEGAQPSRSYSYSDNTTSSWQQQARKLLKPEEVMALPPRVAITFTPGVPPICTTLLRYYEEKSLGKRQSRWWRCFYAARMLFRAGVLCAASLVLAALLTGASMHQARTRQEKRAEQERQPELIYNPLPGSSVR